MRYAWLLALGACATSARGGMNSVREVEGRRERGSEALITALDGAQAVEAATVMGRIQSPAYLPHLARAAAPGHRAELAALWAIGQTAFGYDWRGCGDDVRNAVAARLGDGDPRARAQAAIAWGRIGGDPAKLTAMLKDADAIVRIAATRGMFWAWYLHKLKGGAPALIAEIPEQGNRDVRWNMVYTLQAYADPAARDVLTKEASDDNVWCRLYAVRGLRKISQHIIGEQIPESLRNDPEYLVRVEAGGRADDPSHHVRMAYARRTADPRMLEDFSADVRGEAIAALARDGKKDAAREGLGHLDWRIRARAVEAIGELAAVKRALADPDKRVVQAAATALGSIGADDSFAVLERLVSHGDVGVEWCAIEALVARGDKRAVAALSKRAQGKVTIVFEPLIDALEKVGGVEALQRLTQSDYPYREMARRAVWRLTGKDIPPPSDKTPSDKIPFLSNGLPRIDILFRRGSPGFIHSEPLRGRWILDLRHDKGTVSILLEADVAPEHVTQVVSLARAGYYNGLEWHRVVSSFVIQGGDPRNDGYGDPGRRILDEINTLPHLQGAVGMSKMAKDTGDSQLYITHVPTPHLDGRYTVFGYVTHGMDIVHRIETGDRILRAEVRPAE